MFTETNPDKGTETSSLQISIACSLVFTETNPDKGTETGSFLIHYLMILPLFTETNPDKGTETNQICQIS